MDERQQRGLAIAKSSRIIREGMKWVVPSQTGHGVYHVETGGLESVCDCPDCQTRHTKCKHIWAVEYYCKIVTDSEGNKTVTKAVKVTYAQDWSAYDKAQTHEGEFFMRYLSDLCGGIQNKPYVFGRPTVPMSDMVFVSALKVYSTFSLRRFANLMKTANEKKYIDGVVHYSTVARYMEKEELTPILMNLIKQSSIPLASVESDFAVDSSGFSTSRFDRWFSFKYGKVIDSRMWIKAHIACGTKTNIVTAVKLTESTGADSPQFKGLIEDTAQNFQIKEVSADMGYLARDNLEVVGKLGGEAFIPFKQGTTGKARGSMIWAKMFHYFQFNREEFLTHYHKRSNVETVFHMVKAKFGDSVRSKTKTAQLNEVLLKLLCHNVCVLIQESFELGINVVEKVAPVLQK